MPEPVWRDGPALGHRYPPDLPYVEADRNALLQIFTHLLSYSGAASASDTELHLSVQHETEQRPGADPLNYLIISATDTGGGTAPEDRPRVFSRHYRADAPLIGGLGNNGTGLAIAKALVEGHGCRLWVISDPGAGSTFYVILPLESKYAKADGARRERTKVPITPPQPGDVPFGRRESTGIGYNASAPT